MSPSRPPHKFGVAPWRRNLGIAHRRLSPGRNCNAASGPTFPLLPTEPSGKPTGMMTLDQLICGEVPKVLDTSFSRLPGATPPTFSLVRSQFRAIDQPLTPHAQQSMDDRPVGCGLYELQRPVFAAAGIFVGTLPPNRIQACREALILLGFEALAEEAADAKGDFHDAQFDGKHSENHLNSRHFLKAMKSRQTLKTMATVLNHTVCGGSCGDERRALWPA
jgi:hypothetical protein